MLEVQTKDNILVVDSRLVAEELGIEHKTLRETIKKYEDEIVEEYGQLSVASETVANSVGAKNKITYYFLTEEQATYLMTLSQNTKQVRKAKLNLVTSFSKAKKVLSSVNPELLQLFSTMTEQMKVLTARTERLDAINKATETKKGIKGVLDTEIEDCYPEDLSYTVREYLVMKKQSLDNLHIMRKRAIGFWKQSCQVTELPKKGNEVLFVGNNIAFLDQALKTVLGLD